MIAKVLILLLGLTALSGARAEASDGLSEVVAELLNTTVEGEAENAGAAAELLIELYEGDAYPRSEKILGCLKDVQRCWKDVVSNAAEPPTCAAMAQSCGKLVMSTSRPPLSVQIEVRPPGKRVLYKTLDLCGEGFEVSKLHDAAAADDDLALAVSHMHEKGIPFSSYCFIHFYSKSGLKTIEFHPMKFERSAFLGSPSPDTPSYDVTIDAKTGRVTSGHYVK